MHRAESGSIARLEDVAEALAEGSEAGDLVDAEAFEADQLAGLAAARND